MLFFTKIEFLVSIEDRRVSSEKGGVINIMKRGVAWN